MTVDWLSQHRLNRRTERLGIQEVERTVWLTSPLTSTSWDGDAYSTTAKTKIDLSAVFGVPDGIRAVYVQLDIRDSGSGTGPASRAYLVLSPNNTGDSGPLTLEVTGLVNDSWHHECAWVPCDSSGDIYYQIAATGSGTMDVYLRIWGYQY